MLRKNVNVAVLAIVFFSTGCSRPDFDLWTKSGKEGPTAAALITHIQCELRRAVALNGHKDYFKGFVAAGNLTVEVTNNQAFNPSFNFISPYTTPMTNVTLAVGAQLTGSQHRTFNYVFPIDLAQTIASAETAPEHQRIACAKQATNPASMSNSIPEADGTGIDGDLGLEQVLAMGRSIRESTVDTSPAVNDGIQGASAADAQVFGSQIDFTINYGVNGGPNWTLTHFKGPSGGGGGGSSGSGSGGSSGGGGGQLLNFNRIDKDTLVISFAERKTAANPPVSTPTSSGRPLLERLTPDQLRALSPDSIEKVIRSAPATPAPPVAQSTPGRSAYDAAQSNNTRMILQNLLPQ